VHRQAAVSAIGCSREAQTQDPEITAKTVPGRVHHQFVCREPRLFSGVNNQHIAAAHGCRQASVLDALQHRFMELPVGSTSRSACL